MALAAKTHAEPVAAWRRVVQEPAGSQAAWEPQPEQDAHEPQAQVLAVFSQELEEPAAAPDETPQSSRRFQSCSGAAVLAQASDEAR